MSVRTFTEDGGGKIALNLALVTHAVPHANNPAVTIVSVTGDLYFTINLVIGFEDFVFAWNQALTPAPPVQVVRSGR